MSKKFSVIVADPPYGFSDKLQHSDVKRGALANYDTMTISDIESLPIKDYCDPAGAVLCLWVPSSLLQEGLNVMKAWGFTQKQTFIWIKTKKEPFKDIRRKIFKAAKGAMVLIKDTSAKEFKPTMLEFANIISCKFYQLKLNDILSFGMGRIFRNCHEICLIGTSNNKIYKELKNKSQRSVCFAPNLKHSAKPEELQNSLDIMFSGANKLELFARRERPGWTCLGNEIDGKDIRDALTDL